VFIFPRAFVVQETSGDGSRRCFVATTRGGNQGEAKRREENKCCNNNSNSCNKFLLGSWSRFDNFVIA
jgi:hypothetical protein